MTTEHIDVISTTTGRTLESAELVCTCPLRQIIAGLIARLHCTVISVAIIGHKVSLYVSL